MFTSLLCAKRASGARNVAITRRHNIQHSLPLRLRNHSSLQYLARPLSNHLYLRRFLPQLLTTPNNHNSHMKLTFNITSADHGKTIRQFFAEKGYSGTTIKKFKYDGEIAVNGQREIVNYVLREGDVLSLATNDGALHPEPSQTAAQICYADEFLYVCDKPYGINTHPDRANREDTLANRLSVTFGNDFTLRIVTQHNAAKTRNTQDILGTCVWNFTRRPRRNTAAAYASRRAKQNRCGRTRQTVGNNLHRFTPKRRHHPCGTTSADGAHTPTACAYVGNRLPDCRRRVVRRHARQSHYAPLCRVDIHPPDDKQANTSIKPTARGI